MSPKPAPRAVIVLVEASVKQGKLDAVLSAFEQSRARSHEWTGCESFEVTRPEGRDDVVVVVERWASADDHKREIAAIMAGEGFRRFRSLLTKDLAFQYLAVASRD